MPLPSYLQDEDEDQQAPFLGNQYDEDDPSNPNAFAVGDASAPPSNGQVGPALPTPPPMAYAPPRSVTPEMQAIFNSGTPSAPPGQPPVVDKANKAREDFAAAKGNIPLPPQPKWWQRALAGAVGGAAGYENASGKRMAPINPGPAIQGIMGSAGYQRKLAEYNKGVTGAQANADAAQAEEAAWWKNRQLNNQEQLQQAQAQQATEHAAYWRHRAQSEQNEWKVDPKTGNLYNTVTGEVHEKAQNIQDRVLDYEAAGYTNEEAKIVASGGHLTAEKPAGNANEWQMYLDAYGGNNTKALAAWRADKIAIAQGSKTPRSDEPKPPTRNQMRGVEAKKGDRLNAAEAQARRRIGQGEDSDTVYSDLNQEKQRIQNEYEGEIQASTGDYPGHFDYSAQQPPAAQAPPAPAPAPKPNRAGGRTGPGAPAAPTPGAVSEKELRASAAAAGKDPEAAVALARQRKIQLVP